MESLALSLLPVFATALDLDENFFEEAFKSPMFRLRLSHYPPAPPDTDQYGIAPHTDTSFLTLLAQVVFLLLFSSICAREAVAFNSFCLSSLVQDQEGLVVSSPSGRWTRVPNCPGLLVVNTGELLRQWANDCVSSTPHFVVNLSEQSRWKNRVKKRGLNLMISVIFEQVQPALLFQLLPNPRDELSAILYLGAATTPISGHQLPPIPGGCSGRVRAHMVVRVKLRVRVGFSLVAFCILQYLKKICKSIKYFLQK